MSIYTGAGKTETQPSSPNEGLVYPGGKVREITYDPEEFKRLATGRIRYEILRKAFNSSGLPGYALTLAVSAISEDGHIIKYEESVVLDPFEVADRSECNNAYDAMKEELQKMISLLESKAKTEFNAKPGRWC